MAREIQLSEEKTIVLVTEQNVKTSNITVLNVTDYGDSVVANVSLQPMQGAVKNLVLWEGDAYTNIGQWTDEDVTARILELI